MAAKDVHFGEIATNNIIEGINVLAKEVYVTASAKTFTTSIILFLAISPNCTSFAAIEFTPLN